MSRSISCLPLIALLFCGHVPSATSKDCENPIFCIDSALKDSLCMPFTYGDWHGWSSCSESCGGGTLTRYKEACVQYNKKWDYAKCNEFCYNGNSYTGGQCDCSSWRSGRCCQDCSHINIAHCKPGQQACGGSPDGIKCTNCYDPYYSAGYGRGCAACPDITHCESRHCTSHGNTTCLKCHDDNMLYLRTHSDTKCERTCSWDNHYCWPGQCYINEAQYCNCAPGFHRQTGPSETTCQLDSSNAPSIEKCETRVIGPNGEMKRASSTTSSLACSDLADFYGNFQPKRLIYDLLTEFTVNVSSYTKPNFINESNFGVSDVSLRIQVQSITGSNSHVMDHTIFAGAVDSSDVVWTKEEKYNMSLGASPPQLSDGQWLCVIYEAYGGGFLRSVDLTQSRRVPSAPVQYQKTNAIRRLCYRYDCSPPEHCKLDNSCTYEPLQISKIVVRTPLLTASFPGWTDPVPVGGNITHASGIESYQLIVHEVDASKDMLKVDTRLMYTKTVGSSVRSVTMNLTSDTPKLYAVYLEVKDVADNIRQTRRLVLFDDSSYIAVKSDKEFLVESASPQTDYTWQTHHNDICLNWTDYFYNHFYLDNPLLSPVEPDPSGLINGGYEQQTGLLSVSGTPNVHGIVEFRTSCSLNEGTPSSESTVKNFQSQHYCNNFNVTDGESYTINIKAVDIAGNSYAENRTVHIDRSAPHINNIRLVKDGEHRMLFVHDRTDSSNVKLYFEAMDPHSGIKEIQWAFGTSDSGAEIMTGHIATNAIDKDCPNVTTDDRKCYCPDVGRCEFYQYTIPVNELVAADKNMGDQNRTYYFTIKATNHAMLNNLEHLDFLANGTMIISDAEASRLSPAAIAGITVGVLIAIVAITSCTLLMVLLLYKKKNQTDPQAEKK